ncbi:DUF2079 domain-containing protein [Streptomyces sp. NPDC050856]|uniref:DUF2079 domain-containing protein n=1 Tax=Streptomyces sp. NPDC050856 TaxID=3154939 RepID=UPI0033EC8501
MAFAVPLTLAMFHAALRERYSRTLVCGALLTCVKEDLGLVVGVFGVVLVLRTWRAQDRPGMMAGSALALGGPAVSAFAVLVMIPLMGGEPGYYWNYQELGPDAASALWNIASHPALVLDVAFDAPVKGLLLLWIFGSLLFLPLYSATSLCMLPLLAERLLSSNPNHWTAARHYDAFLWPILVTAAIEATARLLGTRRRAGENTRRRLIAPAVAVVAATTSLVITGERALFDPVPDRVRINAEALKRAAAVIPEGASVEADNHVVPRLTAKADVVLVDGRPRGMEYVLISTVERAFPFQDVRQQVERVRLLSRHGYRRVWEEDGVLVLRRVGVTPIPGQCVPDERSVPVTDVVPPNVGHNLFRG